MGRDQLEQPEVEQSCPWTEAGQGQEPGWRQGKEIPALQRELGRRGSEGLRGHL